MKSILIFITIVLSLFLYSLSTFCTSLTGDLVTKSNCLKGDTALNFTCCYEVTYYTDKAKKIACFPYIKNKTYIDTEINLKKLMDYKIDKIDVDCSSFFLKTFLFILLLLF